MLSFIVNILQTCFSAREVPCIGSVPRSENLWALGMLFCFLSAIEFSVYGNNASKPSWQAPWLLGSICAEEGLEWETSPLVKQCDELLCSYATSWHCDSVFVAIDNWTVKQCKVLVRWPMGGFCWFWNGGIMSSYFGGK